MECRRRWQKKNEEQKLLMKTGRTKATDEPVVNLVSGHPRCINELPIDFPWVSPQ